MLKVSVEEENARLKQQLADERAENARLAEEVQARTREVQQTLEYQTATSDVLNVISRAPSQLQPVFEAIVQTATRLCHADSAVVCTRGKDELYHISAIAGHSEEMLAVVNKQPVAADRGTVSGRAVLERRTVQINDALSDPEYTRFDTQAVGQFRTLLGVPLLRESTPIGVVSLQRRRVEPFTEKQIDLLTTFADQAVVAIENTRLFEELQARTAELRESLEYQTATSDVLNVISRSPNQLQPVLDAIVETAGRLCRAYDANLWLRQGERLKNAAHRGPIAVDFDSWPIGRGWTAGRAFVDRATVHVDDLAASDEFPDGKMMALRLGHRTIVSTPLMRKDEAIGVLAVRRTEVRPFSEKQIALLQSFADQAVIAIENVRLFDEVQARTAEVQEALNYQTATSNVLDVISRSPDRLQPVLQAIVETAARICNAAYADIFLADSGKIYIAATFGDLGRPIGEALPLDRTSVMGRTIVDAASVHVTDLQAEEHDFPLGRKLALRYGHRAILGVPLMRQKEAIGGVLLRRTAAEPFSEKQIAVLRTFADQAVIAIQNVRLFEELQARTAEVTEALEQQTATSELLEVISSSKFDIQPVLDTLVDSAARLCEAESAFVYRRDGDIYRVVANRGFSDEYVQFIRKNPIPPARGTCVGRTALTAAVVHMPDCLADPEYTWPESQRIGGFRTMLGVPLLREGSPIGVISLTRTTVRPFDRKQIKLVETFADQAVIAIENTRLFEEVQTRTQELARSVSELQALGEVSHAVNSTLDLETVLSTIVAKAVQLSATEAGAIYVFSKLRQKFRLRATYGMSEEMIAEFGRQGVGLGESYIGKATESGEAVQVPDLVSEPASPIRDLVLNAGYRALLVVPLLRPGRVVGALVVRRKEPGLFPGSTIDLLQTFAAQSVLATQNARLFEDVEARTRELAKSLEELRAAQERLIQTEKLASLGQLTAGIAHEIKNPLNFVNNFAALSLELLDELKEGLRSAPQDEEQRAELMTMLSGNLEKVVQHGKRADSIVKNMLLHSRAGLGERRLADINALVEESLNLAYHGARAEKQGFNITLERSLDPLAGELELLPQEITRVFLNLISNGFYATVKRKEQATGPYDPILLAGTRNLGEQVEIRIRDNGTGIPPEVKEKMFEPFFTTKPAGEGTGLGLSLSHDIVVKQHRGSIEVDSSPGEFTEFRIVLPRSGTEG